MAAMRTAEAKSASMSEKPDLEPPSRIGLAAPALFLYFLDSALHNDFFGRLLCELSYFIISRGKNSVLVLVGPCSGFDENRVCNSFINSHLKSLNICNEQVISN